MTVCGLSPAPVSCTQTRLVSEVPTQNPSSAGTDCTVASCAVAGFPTNDVSAAGVVVVEPAAVPTSTVSPEVTVPAAPAAGAAGPAGAAVAAGAVVVGAAAALAELDGDVPLVLAEPELVLAELELAELELAEVEADVDEDGELVFVAGTAAVPVVLELLVQREIRKARAIRPRSSSSRRGQRRRRVGSAVTRVAPTGGSLLPGRSGPGVIDEDMGFAFGWDASTGLSPFAGRVGTW